MRKGGAYLLPVLIQACTAFASVPILIAFGGKAEWTGLVVAQSVGAILAVVVDFGWTVVGPARVAAMGPSARSMHWADSVNVRRTLFALVLVPYLTLATLLEVSGSNLQASLIVGLTPMVAALGANWLFVGAGEPETMLRLDTIPRNGGIVVGLAVLMASGSLTAFACLQLSGAVLAVLLAHAIVRRNGDGQRASWSILTASQGVRRNARSALISLTAMTYMQLPIVVLSLVHPAGLAIYALADKLRGNAQMATTPLTQFVQGYVPAHGGDADEHKRRIDVTLKATALVALIAVPTFVLILGPLGHALSGQRITIPIAVALPVGLAFGCVILNSVTGFALLISLDRTRAVAASTMAGAAVGIGACIVLGSLWGGPGAAVAALLAEGTVLGVQLLVLSRSRAAMLRAPVQLQG